MRLAVGILALAAAPACVGLPNELELWASRTEGDHDIGQKEGSYDGDTLGASLHFPLTYPGAQPGSDRRDHERPTCLHPARPHESAPQPPADPGPSTPEAASRPAALEPSNKPEEPGGPSPDEPPATAATTWWQSEAFLAWIERLVIAILAIVGTLAGKKGLDKRAEARKELKE